METKSTFRLAEPKAEVLEPGLTGEHTVPDPEPALSAAPGDSA